MPGKRSNFQRSFPPIAQPHRIGATALLHGGPQSGPSQSSLHGRTAIDPHTNQRRGFATRRGRQHVFIERSPGERFPCISATKKGQTLIKQSADVKKLYFFLEQEHSLLHKFLLYRRLCVLFNLINIHLHCETMDVYFTFKGILFFMFFASAKSTNSSIPLQIRVKTITD